MKALFVCFAVCLLVGAMNASADTMTLTEDGTSLGRVNADDIGPSLAITVELAGDEPTATFVMARFQNNSPAQRLPDGEWVSWNEQTESLVDNGLHPSEDGSLTFNLVQTDLTDRFLPVIFTVAYLTDTGLKSGFVVVDR